MKHKSLPSRRLFDRQSAAAVSGETQSVSAAKYQRHVDCVDQVSSDESEQEADSSRRDEKHLRELHFAFLPEKYERLRDDEERAHAKEEKKKKKKENYKKVRKVNVKENNVGKALRATWKCLMLGLYNFALGYSTPITVAATFVPDFHPGRDRT